VIIPTVAVRSREWKTAGRIATGGDWGDRPRQQLFDLSEFCRLLRPRRGSDRGLYRALFKSDAAARHCPDPRRVWEIADTHVRLVAFYLFLHRIRKKVECDARPYHDPALLPVETEPGKPAGMPKLKAAAAA